MTINHKKVCNFLSPYERGIYGTDIRLGQSTVKLTYCREGIRSIPLCDEFNNPYPCASLLVYFRKKIHKSADKVELDKMEQLVWGVAN